MLFFLLLGVLLPVSEVKSSPIADAGACIGLDLPDHTPVEVVAASSLRSGSKVKKPEKRFPDASVADLEAKYAVRDLCPSDMLLATCAFLLDIGRYNHIYRQALF